MKKIQSILLLLLIGLFLNICYQVNYEIISHDSWFLILLTNIMI